MKKEVIIQYYNEFESAAMDIDGVECWSARDLQQLLGYSKWENFSKVIDKAKVSCENAGHVVADHFPDVRKMVGNYMTSVFARHLRLVNNFREILPLAVA